MDKTEKYILWLGYTYLTILALTMLVYNKTTCIISLYFYILPSLMCLITLNMQWIEISKGDISCTVQWKDILEKEDLLILSFTALANFSFLKSTIENKDQEITPNILAGDDKYIKNRIIKYINENNES